MCRFTTSGDSFARDPPSIFDGRVRIGHFQRYPPTNHASCVFISLRSLVQIKSHAQKVLKRMEAGENVFRRLEENYSLVDNLVVQAAKQHEGLTLTSHSPKSTMAKRKKQTENEFMDQSSTQSFSPIYTTNCVESGPEPPIDGDVAALAASALCQLSSLPS